MSGFDTYRFRDLTERFIFQGGSAYGIALADYIDQLHAENARLKAELAEAKKDAERYRWLRDNKFRHNGHCLALTGQILWETDLDKACDQAMKGK